jgi:mono/diheme cytochrome c family protein
VLNEPGIHCERHHDRERHHDPVEGGAMSRFGITPLAVAVAVGSFVLGVGVAVVSGQGEWKAPAEAKNQTNPVKGIGNAKKTVETNCVMCHGPSGKGDGPAAAALPPPKPADWTSPNVQSQPDGELFWKISNGRGAMPPWKHLPEKDRWEIVNYIRTLKK